MVKQNTLCKKVTVKNVKKRFVNTAHFESMIGMFRMDWIKDFLSETESIWFHIAQSIYNKV